MNQVRLLFLKKNMTIKLYFTICFLIGIKMFSRNLKKQINLNNPFFIIFFTFQYTVIIRLI